MCSACPSMVSSRGVVAQCSSTKAGFAELPVVVTFGRAEQCGVTVSGHYKGQRRCRAVLQRDRQVCGVACRCDL